MRKESGQRMPETGSPQDCPATPGTTAGRWSVRRLALLFFPAVTAALWINLFMLSLLLGWLGLPRLSPLQAAVAALPFAVPLSWAAGSWIRDLMDRADGKRG